MLKLAVCVSGGGTNLQAIMDAIDSGAITDTSIEVVISNNKDAYALERAKAHGIHAICISPKDYESRADFNEDFLVQLNSYHVDLVVLAGFMRILSPYFVDAYRHQILNIHPSLLPSFGGAHAHRDVLAYGTKVSGCTIHFVDEGMDHGPIILQDTVPVLDGDTEETLAARVLEKEHILYPRAIELFVDGRLELLDDRHVRIKE